MAPDAEAGSRGASGGYVKRLAARALSAALGVPTLCWRRARVLSRRKKISAAAAAAIIALAYFSIAPFYRKAGAELREKLAAVRSTTSSSPLVITVGERRPLSELAAYLQAAGYSEAASASDRRRGLYRIINSGQVLEIYPGGGETSRRDSVRIAFEADGSAIRTISLITTGESVLRWEIKPLQLASYDVRRTAEGKAALTAYSYAALDDLRASRAAQAVEFIEDRRFATRWLFIDPRSIARAAVSNAKAGEVKEGGSTIFQQLAKMIFISPEERQERSWRRKLKELAYASAVWQHLSRDEARELYLNLVPMGASADGIELRGLGAAARAYFGKHVANLSPEEVVILTTLIESARYSPLLKAPRAVDARADRSRDVAESLAEAGIFSQGELAAIFTRQPDVSPALWPDGMGDYLSLVNRELKSISRRVDLTNRPLRITSSINPALQKAASDVVRMHAPALRQKSGSSDLEVAVVMLDVATGECLAVVGRGNTDKGSPASLNLALQAKRPLGSVFKIFVYAAAFETALVNSGSEAHTPATLVVDAPTVFRYGSAGQHAYGPRNYDGHYRMRLITLYEGLWSSSNVLAVNETLKAGPRRVADIAEAAGLDRPDDRFPSIALGTSGATLWQVTNAYATFARGGRAIEPHAVSRIESDEGTVLYAPAPEGQQIIDARAAYLTVRGLAGVFDSPSGTAHQVRARPGAGLDGVTYYGKTGTSRDSWFVGMNARVVCGVWVGNKSFKQSRLTGAQGALKVWADIMAMARRARPELFEGEIVPPPGIVDVTIDPHTGLVAQGDCPDAVTYPFIRGTEPKQHCAHAGVGATR